MRQSWPKLGASIIKRKTIAEFSCGIILVYFAWEAGKKQSGGR